MTVTEGASATESAAEVTSRRVAWLPYAVFAVAVLGIYLLGRGDTGRQDPWLLVGLGSAVPLYIVARAWRLPTWMHIVALALPVSILIVAAIHGYPEGAARASRYAYGAILVLAFAAWATTPRRRVALAVAGGLLAVDQYIAGWYWWWGMDDPDALMLGMFGWHNQFGIYLAIGAALGAVVAMVETRVVMLVGAVIVAFTTAGVAASGSRANMALLVGALLVALVIGVVVHRWRALPRWVALVGVSVGTVFLMRSPIFFSTVEGSPLAMTERGGFENSWVERVEFWRVGLVMGIDHWFAGVGNANYGQNNVDYGAFAYSSHPHNELVLAWAENGMLGLLPLLAAYLGGVWLIVRSIVRPLDAEPRRISWLPGRAELVGDPGRWAGLLALLVALIHAFIDFDWAWPSICALVGLVAGLASAPLVAARAGRPTSSRALAVLNVGMVAVLLAAAVTGYVIDPLRLIPAMPVGGWPVIDR